jgi:hypothetical protein
MNHAYGRAMTGLFLDLIKLIDLLNYFKIKATSSDP